MDNVEKTLTLAIEREINQWNYYAEKSEKADHEADLHDMARDSLEEALRVYREHKGMQSVGRCARCDQEVWEPPTHVCSCTCPNTQCPVHMAVEVTTDA